MIDNHDGLRNRSTFVSREGYYYFCVATMFKKDITAFSALFISLNFFGSFCNAFNPSVNDRSRQMQRSTPILVYATPGDGIDGARHTYVEGGEYDDVFSEIEAMGGGTPNCPVFNVMLGCAPFTASNSSRVSYLFLRQICDLTRC